MAIKKIIYKFLSIYSIILSYFVFYFLPSYRYTLLRLTPYQTLRKKIWTSLGNKIGKDSYLNHSITLLDSPHLNPNIILGARVALSPNITFITHSSPNNSNLQNIKSNKKYLKTNPIKIGDDTWVGTNTTIQPNITIGERCIIGSMSNVTKNIPDDTLAYGNPIKIIKKLNQ